MKIQRFNEYSLSESIIDDFINSIKVNESTDDDSEIIDEILRRFKEKFGDKRPTSQEFADFYHDLRSQGIDGILIFDTLEDVIPDADRVIIEDDDLKNVSAYKRIEKKVLSDLRLDTKLVFTFGAGIGALYPIVAQMLKNMSLNIEVSKRSVVLLTIAAITITYLEEKKTKSTEEEELLDKDSRSMLEELRMRGIGDGIVKKVIKALSGVKNIFLTIAKHLGAAVGGIIDMFSYTSILIPIMNAVFFIIGEYEMSIDDVIANFFTLSVGIATRIAKHGLVEIINLLKNLIPNKAKKEIIDEIETPVIQKFGDFTHGTYPVEAGEPINEQ